MLRLLLSGFISAFLAICAQPIVAQSAQWGGGASPGDIEFGVYAPTLLDLSGKELSAGKRVYFGFECKEKPGFVEAKLTLRVYGDVGLNAPGTLRRSFLFLGTDADSDVPVSFIGGGSNYYEMYDKATLTSLFKLIAFGDQSQKLLIGRDRMLVLPPGNAALPGALAARRQLLACFEGPGNARKPNFQFEDGYLALAEQARAILVGGAQQEKSCQAANQRLVECVSGVDWRAGGVADIVCGGYQPGSFGSPASACSPLLGFWCDLTTGNMYESRANGADALCR